MTKENKLRETIQEMQNNHGMDYFEVRELITGIVKPVYIPIDHTKKVF